MVSAQEAKESGIVSKVRISITAFIYKCLKIFPADTVVDEAIKTATKIAEQSPLIVRMCKEAVNRAFETTLQEGLRFERRIFHSTFATVRFSFVLFLFGFFRKIAKKECRPLHKSALPTGPPNKNTYNFLYFFYV